MVRRLLGRRMPEELRRCLPLAPRERLLGWTRCAEGCTLAATPHGLWEWPTGRPPVRLCWADIDALGSWRDTLEVVPGGAEIQATQCPGVRHRVFDADRLVRLAEEQVRASTLVRVPHRLSSGQVVELAGRRCPMRSEVSWRVRFPGPRDEDDPESRAEAGSALDRLRAVCGG